MTYLLLLFFVLFWVFFLPGPTLLFEKVCKGSEKGRRFYACSACRDRKDCKFFQWEDEKVRSLGV